MKITSLLLVIGMTLQGSAAFGNELAKTGVTPPVQKETRVDGPQDQYLFNIEPSSISLNYDVDAFLSGKCDHLMGFDARPERHSTTAK